jgi:hypothetical protein
VDFSLSEEQQELQGLARQILSDRMTLPWLKELDSSEEWFDRETWAELAKSNLLSIALVSGTASSSCACSCRSKGVRLPQCRCCTRSSRSRSRF